MAPITYPNYYLTKTEYTFSEAIEHMKMLDQTVTDPLNPIRWKSVRTGKEVIIGYTGSKPHQR